MSTNVVNLDALIPREDLGIITNSQPPGNVDKITIPHLTGFVFAPDLRKPQFQRETNQWTPGKVTDLLTAFVDRALIPAVILWRAGPYIFVVDGAHRLSALLAWVNNDYGDGTFSQKFFAGKIPDEQLKLAARTRKMVDKVVGSFNDYEEARKGVPKAPHIMERLAHFADCTVIAQWVPTADPKSAEESFFKINQAATPIDATEKRILKARDSATAIAARAITNAGNGHKYWSQFDAVARAKIEEAATDIHASLYSPPITGAPITTLDVPVAGQGYNALPFVFDLVNEINGVVALDTTTKKSVKEVLPVDSDGSLTLEYLQKVRKALTKITSDSPGSLGLHPVVYFYTKGGAFRPEAFFAAHRFIAWLILKNALKKFTAVRGAFEDYLVNHKDALAAIVHKYGTGNRSIPALLEYYQKLYEIFESGADGVKAHATLGADSAFAYLVIAPIPHKPQPQGKKQPFSTKTKTAAFFEQALDNCVRCGICGARVHKNSMHIDHKTEQKAGGHAGLKNAQVTHPFCDSSKQPLK